MIKTLLSLLCMIICATGAIAQKVWIFGSNVGLDFNTVPPTTIIPPPQIFGGAGGGNPFNYSTEGNATITDAGGQLLFYTNGKHIYNRNFYTMPNGSDAGFVAYTQGSVIVPMPDSAHKYYVFSIEQKFEVFTNPAQKGRLTYSIVNMNLDNGFGDVEPGKKTIPLDSILTGKITAVLGDKCNIWVVVRSRNSNDWKSYEITPQGINPIPVISTCGNFSSYYPVPTFNGGFFNAPYFNGVIRFSPNRKKMIAAISKYHILGIDDRHGMELYDFDPATGQLSNPISLDTTHGYYGACFSPDGSKAYGCYHLGIDVNQWDLSLGSNAAIIGSKALVGQINLTPIGITYADLKAAPDGKIYMSRPGGTPYIARFMHTINQPNLPGAACQFMFNGYQLLPAGYNPLTANTIPRAALPNEITVYKHDTAAQHKRMDTAACWNGSVILKADTSGWDYVWNDGIAGPVRTVTASGTYIVYYMTSPCRQHADTFNVVLSNSVPELRTIKADCTDTGYVMWVVPPQGDTAEYTYTWFNTSGQVLRTKADSRTGDTLLHLSPGTYSVTIVNDLGCDTLLSATLLPVIKAGLLPPATGCQGKPITFQNTSSGAGTFLWNFGDGTTSTADNPTHVYNTPGTYNVSLVMTDTSRLCTDTAFGTVVVDTLPYLSFTWFPEQVCEGASVVFLADYRSGIEELLWDFGDGLYSNSGVSVQTTHAFDTSGSLIVTAVGKYPNCPDVYFGDTVTVYPYPVVTLGPDTFLCPGGDPVLLYNMEPYHPGNKYQWNTGDTTDRILVRHHARYALTVTSGNNCTSSDSADVFKSCYIDIPNVFTPNGDGMNDYFLPRQLLSHALRSFHMRIYNRWGEMIFETNSVSGRGWDGDYNGMAQPQSVYVYLIEAAFENGATERYQGNVTLIR